MYTPPPSHARDLSPSPQKKNTRTKIRWEKGDGRLLPEFQCYRDLYEHKLRQQEALSKQLRRQQRTIKESEGDSTTQRKMFAGLHTLLKCKLQITVRAASGSAVGGSIDGLGGAGAGGGLGGRARGGDGGGGGGGGRRFMRSGDGIDEAYLKAIDAQSGRGGGAPDIMTLED